MQSKEALELKITVTALVRLRDTECPDEEINRQTISDLIIKHGNRLLELLTKEQV